MSLQARNWVHTLLVYDTNGETNACRQPSLIIRPSSGTFYPSPHRIRTRSSCSFVGGYALPSANPRSMYSASSINLRICHVMPEASGFLSQSMFECYTFRLTEPDGAWVFRAKVADVEVGVRGVGWAGWVRSRDSFR